LFYFHAFRFKRIAPLPHEIAKRLNIRIIAPDRPGFGLSDLKPGRSMSDWSSDVLELADTLKIDRFAVFGHSGGGPFAIVCAHNIPNRLTKVAAVSSLGPHNLPAEAKSTFDLLPRSYVINSRILAWTANAYLRLSGRFGYSSRVLSLAAVPSGTVLAAPPELTQFLNGLGDGASRPRRYGAVWEIFLYSQPWGIRLQDIPVEVQLWHGESDSVVPPPLMRFVARSIPNCRARFLPSEDHFAVTRNHMADILADLAH
jgi:pimeloyl-ACP methyl ester carboxylesterase